MSREAPQRMVGRYELIREIGRGGMAVVHLARQPELDRFVAIKELASFYAADAAMADRFLKEARLAGSLSHPNIVTVYDYIAQDGVPYILMEYLPRGSLRPLARRLSLAQAVGALQAVLAGGAGARCRRCWRGSRPPGRTRSCTGTSSPRTSWWAGTASRSPTSG